MNTSASQSPLKASRKRRIAMLARATHAELAAAWMEVVQPPAFIDLRKPEAGMVMVRGRIGGDGSPFNFGEATVTRAAVRLETGAVGHGYVLGRDGERARLAAVFDALGESKGFADVVETLMARVETRLSAERAQVARQSAATRVDFFTLVRGANA